jgi:hypothetical protein
LTGFRVNINAYCFLFFDSCFAVIAVLLWFQISNVYWDSHLKFAIYLPSPQSEKARSPRPSVLGDNMFSYAYCILIISTKLLSTYVL